MINIKTDIAKNKELKKNTSYVGYGHDLHSDGSKRQRGIARSGEPITFDTKTIRANVRSACTNSTVARGIIKRKTHIVIESGLKFKSNPLYNVIGITEEEAEKKGKDITELVHLFFNSKCFTSDEKMTGYQAQRFWFTNMSRDGEVWIKINRKYKSPNQITSLSLQTIDPDLIDSDSSFVSTDGNIELVSGGIKYDKYGKEKSVEICSLNENGSELVTIPIETKDGIKILIHGFIPEFPNQGRGISDIGHLLQELQDITDFDQAHIMKAIEQSVFAMATESEGEEDSVNPLENNLVETDNEIVDAILSDTTTTSDKIQQPVWKSVDEAQINSGGVYVYGLPPNQKIKPIENTAPVTNYHDFLNTFVSNLSSSGDMPFEVLIMKFGENYSASLATLSLAWSIAKILRQEFESDILNEVVRALVEIEISEGRISLPGWQNPRIRQAWLNGVWRGKSKPIIDPNKYASSVEKLVKLGVTCLEEEAWEYNGSIASQNIKKNNEYIKDLEALPWEKQKNAL